VQAVIFTIVLKELIAPPFLAKLLEKNEFITFTTPG
jgi:hypothetical protein